MKKPLYLLTAAAIGFSTLASADNSANVLLCVDETPCYESYETVQKMVEAGAERPLEMFVEKDGNNLGITFSEALGLGQAFLDVSHLSPRLRRFTNLTSMSSGRQGRYSSNVAEGDYGYKPLSDYRTVEMVQINESLKVVIYKPTAEVVVRRDLEEGKDPIRVKMSFDGFIDAVKSGYARFEDVKVSQRNFGKNNSITDTITRAVMQSVFVSSFGPSYSLTAEYFREENVQYTAYRAYADRPGEEKRDFSHSETVRVNGTGGYTHTSLSTNGSRPTHRVRNVDPHVRSVREEWGVNLNGNTSVDRNLRIDIDGEDSIVRNGCDSDYNDWRFSNLTLTLFGQGADNCDDSDKSGNENQSQSTNQVESKPEASQTTQVPARSSNFRSWWSWW